MSRAMRRGSVLVTRPLDDSRRIAGLLKGDGIASLIWPLTRIDPIKTGAPPPAGIDGLLATSAHGIRAYADLCARRDLPVFCVGARTAGVACSLGFDAVSSAGEDAAALAHLAAEAPCRHFLYPRGRDVSHDLADMLTSKGKKVTERIVYAATPSGDPPAPVAEALRRGTLFAVTLWSRRGATLFSDWCRRRDVGLQETQLIAISDRVSSAAEDLRFQGRIIASAPETGAMIAAIRRVAPQLPGWVGSGGEDRGLPQSSGGRKRRKKGLKGKKTRTTPDNPGQPRTT